MPPCDARSPTQRQGRPHNTWITGEVPMRIAAIGWVTRPLPGVCTIRRLRVDSRWASLLCASVCGCVQPDQPELIVQPASSATQRGVPPRIGRRSRTLMFKAQRAATQRIAGRQGGVVWVHYSNIYQSRTRLCGHKPQVSRARNSPTWTGCRASRSLKRS